MGTVKEKKRHFCRPSHLLRHLLIHNCTQVDLMSHVPTKHFHELLGISPEGASASGSCHGSTQHFTPTSLYAPSSFNGRTAQLSAVASSRGSSTAQNSTYSPPPTSHLTLSSTRQRKTNTPSAS